jgi:hypothetical protein
MLPRLLSGNLESVSAGNFDQLSVNDTATPMFNFLDSFVEGLLNSMYLYFFFQELKDTRTLRTGWIV